MLTPQQQIANFLDTDTSALVRCEEWANVWFVIVQVRRPRFVSKKVVKQVKVEAMSLTPEQFEKDCGGSIRSSQVSPEMIGLAKSILKREASRLNKASSNDWFLEPIVDEIEKAIPRCRDRHVQAVLTVAEKWGEDDYGTRVEMY